MSDKLTPPVQLVVRACDAHKGDFGRVLLVGGSRGMAGSIAMSAVAALKTGSGLVTAAVPDRCLETVAAIHPAIMTVPIADDSHGRFSLDAAGDVATMVGKYAAIGCGPGMTTGPGSLRLVERLLHQTGTPRVFDADAINCLVDLDWKASRQSNLVLTPHPGELQRITGVSPKDREAEVKAAGELASQTGAIIVVKGGPTVVVRAGETWTNGTGNPGMATGGAGDVLTGVITSLLGQDLSPWDAARLGVWIHGLAGDIAAEQHGQSGMTAVEILASLPQAVQA